MVEKGKGFQICAHIIMIFLSVCCAAPFILLVISSLTEENTLLVNGYSFFPEKFSAEAYSYVVSGTSSILQGYGISIFVTLAGTLCNLTLTTLYAYPLSRKDLPGRNIFAFILFFTMLFSGGLVPSYIMWTRTFHIQNTLFALIIPGLMMGGFNVIMMRTYLNANVPDTVIEAARIDGASEFKILRSIVIPMGKPILATLCLLVGLSYWNDWGNGLYYINDERLYSVQVQLMNIQRMIDQLQRAGESGVSVDASMVPSASIRMALTVLAVLPVMVIYPFVQKNFVKGIAIGAVKG